MTTTENFTLFDDDPTPASAGLDTREYAGTGKYHGRNATETERASGEAIEADRAGPLKRGKAGHLVLAVYGRVDRTTAYAASFAVSGDYHSKRRESTRLLERGYLVKNGELPNPAPAGRPHVDAFSITRAGMDELHRLGDV